MKVRAKMRLYEDGAIYEPGQEFEIKKARAEALGDGVEPAEEEEEVLETTTTEKKPAKKAKPSPKDKMIKGAKDK